MKKNVYLVMMAVALSVFVWSNSAGAVEKIGYVSIQMIMQDSNAGKKAMEDLKKYYDKQTQEIKSLEKELTKLEEELKKQGSIMTASSRNEKETAYQKKRRDYQLQVDDMNDELRRRDQEITRKLYPQIVKIVRSIAEKEKYTLILEVSTLPMAVYFDKDNDITQKVVEEFNKSK